MDDHVDDIRTAILTGELDALADLPVPDTYRGTGGARRRGRHVRGHRQRATRTRARACTCRRCRRPSVGPGEALVAVMASAINYNTVWTSIFEPVSTFEFLKRYGKSSSLAAKHDQPYHVVGSDLSGVVLRVGAGRDASGSPATRSSRTACRSSSRTRRATTTR